MRLLKTFAVSFLLAAVSITAAAQKRTVSGTVTDEQALPIIGAAVMLNGTTTGAVTDLDGTFVIDVPQSDVVLNVSCIGYETMDVNVPAMQDVVRIVMKEDAMMIEETVVVGYGTQKKVNLTGAITAVDEKALEDRVAPNLTSMLQGAVPGLNITTSSGNPGSTGTFNIRGTGSINGGSPLVLIDGSEGEIDRVNPNDVESISVIKDASAAAVYGARAAFGVILVTTKKGSDTEEGNATVRYSGRFGWEEPTTSTDYETTGYWSAYIHNMFWKADDAASVYINYNDHDMQQLLLRINDRTENPERPWVITERRNGKDQYVYYGNTDWWHTMFNDQHPTQQHNISISGGTKKVKYFLSGGYNRQTGIIKARPDVFQKVNMRSKLDFTINKYVKMTNNTSFYSSVYDYPGVGDVENAIAYSANHGLACFTPKNPDGTWVYGTDFLGYKVANGRHAIYGNDKNINLKRKMDFANTTEVRINPIKELTITANYTYRLHQNRNTNRSTNLVYSQYPGVLAAYTTGAGEDSLSEEIDTWNYHAANLFATYEDTFAKNHHLTVMAGGNLETSYRKDLYAKGYYLTTEYLNDLDLVGLNPDGVAQYEASGGQTEYALLGFFGRINYDYKGKYLVEVSGRYDGTSKFAKGSRWGVFPSASVGWRISEENWFNKRVVNNLKLRASFGSLGNQNVTAYQFIRKVTINDFAGYNFGESSTVSKYASLTAPNAGDLTWETSQQYNVGIDAGLFNDKLTLTVEGYIRDTKNMLTAGVALPSVYGASEPKMNAADLRTKGYEVAINWRDQINVFGKALGYNIGATLSDYKSVITRYDNPEMTFAKDYYVGMELGEIWGFEIDGLFQSDAEAQAYAQEVDLSYINKRLTGGWMAGDVKYVDLNGDGKISVGSNSVTDPGDRKILGNKLATLQYGITAGFDYLGFDVSIFLQGTGNHHWYPNDESMAFWGPYSRPYCTYLDDNFLDNVWSESNPDAYFPRPRAYSAFTTGAPLANVNDRYLQNLRYLRLKNLSVGYTVPKKATQKIGIDKIRVYFSGENLAYASPLKKHTTHIDPEAAFDRVDSDGDTTRYNNAFYPWQKTFMFGIDITF